MFYCHCFRRFSGMLMAMLSITAVLVLSCSAENNDGTRAVKLELAESQVGILLAAAGDTFALQLSPSQIDAGRYQVIITYDEAAELLYGDDAERLVSEEDLAQWNLLKKNIHQAFYQEGLELELHPLASEQYLEKYRELSKAEMGDVVIRGAIFDDSGDPLDNVNVRVVRSRPNPIPFESFLRDTIASESTDSAFRYVVSDAYGVTVIFEKEGYYPARIYANRGQAHGLRPNQAYIRHFDVILVKAGIPTTLERFSGDLVFNIDGSGDAFGFTSLPSPPVEARDLGERHRSHAVNFFGSPEDLSNTDSHAVVLAAAIDETNQKIRQYDFSQLPHARTWAAPAQLELRMMNKDDGFVVLNVSDSVNMRELLRRMRVAPEEGYENQLLFDENRNPGKHIGFYFKFGGFYGKGVLSPPEIYKSGQSVYAGFLIYIQPNGTRNVAGGR